MRLLNPITTGLDTFFFRKVTASGFGLMRVAWSLTACLYLLMQWSDVLEFYSNAGTLPTSLASLVTRSVYHFTILQWIATPEAVFTLYLLLLFTLLCTAFGISTRFMTMTSTLLLFSFHERNPFTLGGGDTLLRHLGFLLCIAPGLSAFSLDRLDMQWREWRRHHTLLRPLQMSIWPYRLLLWQLIVLYGTSLWFKLLGHMWLQGTAVASALHHPTFVRLPLRIVDLLTPLTPFIDFAVLALHTLWITLLIPEPLWRRLPLLGSIHRKRVALLGGLLLHGSILFLMDAGSFSPAVFSAYLGLLLDEDFAVLQNFCNRRCWAACHPEPVEGRTLITRGPAMATLRQAQCDTHIAVLYDGKCGLCQRSIFVLTILDHLRRLRYIDFWKRSERMKVAPHLRLAELDKAMHILVPPHSTTYRGFDAFRELAAHLPPLWPLIPLLYAPGMTSVGRWAYARIAARRKRCKHGVCTL